MIRTLAISGLAAASLFGGAGAANAQSGELVFYCAADEGICRLLSESFQRETGINVLMTRKSSGETYAQLKAEEGQPRGDVWWGGTGDPHLQAAQEGLTSVYQSPMLEELQDWAVRQAETADYRTVGVYAGALGFGYNADLIDPASPDAPKCWADLLNEAYRDEIQVANPNSSGTAYTLLATLVQIMGEDEAFEYLAALDDNISQYTSSGSAPIRAAGTGESSIGIVFMHDAVAQAVQGSPIQTVAPCEGTGYEVGSMSLIEGGPNPENARIFYDWVLTPEAQELGAQANSFQVPSNVNAQTPPESPNLDEIELIDYDFALYGSSDERARLLARWDSEIGAR
ncbi:ABC transporter substrate-binding protein [Pelagibacterium luteolum]|uniref:Iron(III) transport system substrate-binding protein n=1 Tax=Pelagibacterium luteolum TaxID=440168 RepID=A0A1G7XYY3_9HYPH|nr:iron(III) transport system substrate-binding protein [Pelagibacterium luteolum]